MCEYNILILNVCIMCKQSSSWIQLGTIPDKPDSDFSKLSITINSIYNAKSIQMPLWQIKNMYVLVVLLSNNLN